MNKRIVVLGAGESGAGAAVLAKVKGFDVFVSDMSLIKDAYKALLNKYEIEWEDGRHSIEKILNADEIIKSPGIPDTAPVIRKKRNSYNFRDRIRRKIYSCKNDLYHRE